MSLPDLEARESWLGGALFWSEIIVLAGFLLLRLATWATQPAFIPLAQGVPDKIPFSVMLQRGAFDIFEFPSRKVQTLAVVLFGSGDGGWGGWEDAVSRAMADAGYEVVGIDCAKYAKTDYDLDTLQVDFSRMYRAACAPFGGHPPPLIVGGWSMGAEQAVPVAAGPNPPSGLAGLLLVAPGSRGRYGLRISDHLGIPPTGPGTFALADYVGGLGTIRIVQWHAGLDPFDSTAWLDKLSAPHEELDYPNAFHEFNGPSAAFYPKLVDSVAWILQGSSAQVAKENGGSP